MSHQVRRSAGPMINSAKSRGQAVPDVAALHRGYGLRTGRRRPRPLEIGRVDLKPCNRPPAHADQCWRGKTAGKSLRRPVTVLPIWRSVYSIELACKLRKNSALLHRLLCENRIPLAFWLVQQLAPAIFVELGTSLDIVFFILSGGGGSCVRHRGALWSIPGEGIRTPDSTMNRCSLA